MVGRNLGHYRILSQLGAGGMGVVYRARDESLERDVALKVLPAGTFADDAARARFRKEALALSQLNHPHICTIYEVGEAEGQAYIAMEYVEGRPLSESVPPGGLPIENAIRYGAQIADALSHAHDRGVVHRDLKGSNVIVTPDGRSKVLDFGLARRVKEAQAGEATRSQGSLTDAGEVAGTLHYMAPETLRGDPADARTDVWALGVVLYELASGELPFRGRTRFEISSAILKEAPKPLPAAVPAGLRAIIQRCLAKEPGQRYQRASEVQAALDAIHSDAAVVPPAPAPRRRWWPLGVAAAAAVLVAAGVGLYLHGRGPGRIEAIAVLPLDNLSGDAAQNYFADGMTEALITDLAKIGALRVISRTSVMKYRGSNKPLPEIARELNVDAVVEGSVQRSGNRVRVTAQLIHARTDQHLWAENYERDLSDVLSLQSEVARAIANEIKLKLTPQQEQRLTRTARVNSEAYDYYLRAKSNVNLENSAANEAAIGLLEKAVTIDPNFADGYAGLADACAWRAFLFAPQEKQWEEKAERAIQRAFSLDPDSAEAHFARARILWTPSRSFLHEESIRECRRALALNPNLDDAHHQLSLIYIHIGLLDRAAQEAGAAIAINPASASSRYRLGESLLYQTRFEEALAAFRDIPRDYNPSIQGFQTAWALFSLGRKQEAAARIEEALKAHPEDTAGVFASIQAMLYAAAGDQRRAEEKIRAAELRRGGFGHFHHTAYHIASAYALMKRPQPAIQWLQAAADTGFPCYPLFEQDHNLDPLRQEPHFIALMAKLKAQWEHYKQIS